MKIIGTIGNKYLIEGELLEICQIHGFDSLYNNAWEALLKKAHVENRYGTPHDAKKMTGLEFDVSALSDRVSNIREQESKSQETIKNLRALAEALEAAWPSLKMKEVKDENS